MGRTDTNTATDTVAARARRTTRHTETRHTNTT
jgi:hypothetical protein